MKRSVLALLCAFVLAGASVAAAQVKLTWMNHWGAPDTMAFWNQVVAEFEGQNPGIEVEIITADFGNLMTRYLTMYGAGNAPDLYHGPNWLLPQIVDSGGFVPVPAEMEGRIREAYAAIAADGLTYDGYLWGVPTEIGLMGFMYSQRILEEAGVAPPPAEGFTFDEYRAAVNAMAGVTNYGTVFLLNYPARLTQTYINLLWNNGGDLLNEDNTEAAFNSTAGVEVAELMRALVHEDQVAVLQEVGDASGGLAAGRIASYIDANWWKLMLEPTMGEEGFLDIAAVGVPHAGLPQTLAYAYGVSVSAQSEHPDEAWQFAEFINAPRGEGMNSYMGQFLTEFWGILPGRLSDLDTSPDLNHPYIQGYIALLDTARMLPMTGAYPEIERVLGSALEEILLDQKTATQALDDAARTVNQILREHGN